MATNDFIGFASSGSANIMSQADYAAAAEQGIGVQPGMASSKLANKVWRQGANMAAALGSMIAERGYNAYDNGDIAALKTSVIKALAAAPSDYISLTASDDNLANIETNRSYMCGNMLQVSCKITVGTVSSAGWYTVATADLSSYNAYYGDAYMVLSEHVSSSAATSHRDRFCNMVIGSSRTLSIRIYLYAADSGMVLYPIATLAVRKG